MTSSPRQTAALGCIESSPRRADDGDVRECPAARAVEEPAARCGLPAGPHTELPTQNHTPGPRHIARMMPALWRARGAFLRPSTPRPQSLLPFDDTSDVGGGELKKGRLGHMNQAAMLRTSCRGGVRTDAAEVLERTRGRDSGSPCAKTAKNLLQDSP